MATLADLMVRIGVDAADMIKGTDEATGSFLKDMDRIKAGAALSGAAAGGLLAVGFASAMDISAANNKLSNQLALTEAEADRAGTVSGAVFSAGFGGSMEDVNTALAGVHNNIADMGDLTDAELQDMTTSALALATTFDQDVGQATTAVGQLMKNGLATDAEHAFDIITAGFQSGADRGGDLLDTVTEYGTQFRNMGLSGEQAMGLINQGLEGGARNADLVADAIKEFSIEAVAGSDKVRGGFEALGLDADEMFTAIGNGGDEAAGALDTTLDTLRNVEDPIERNAIATELFGTKAEDLGDALYALDPSAATLDNVAGSAEAMSESMEASPAQQMEAAFRTVATTLGQLLLPVITKVAEFAQEHPTLFKIIAAAVLIAALAFGVLTIALWAVNAAVLANPITWIIIAIIAGIALLIAAIIAIVYYWDEIVAATVAAWEWIKSALAAAWEWIESAAAATWNAIAGFFTGMWNKIVALASAVWSRIVAFFQAGMARGRAIVQAGVAVVLAHIAFLRSIPERIRRFFTDAANAARQRIATLISHVKGIPGKIRAAIGNAGNILKSAGRNIIQGLISGVTGMIGSLRSKFSEITGMIPDWKGPMRVDKVLLAPTGAAIMGGLESGIESGIPGLRSTLRGVTDEIPSNVNATVRHSGGTRDQNTLTLDVTGTDQEMVRLIRKLVRVQGRGDVQTAFGR
ncbi:phage tail tape measure protein [Nocardiopsis alba]|uniref:phage tail tape measure protein n=1 Tax=Nocardiopsis alba TaxID=53437 RepID=UPI003D713533